MSVIRNVNFMFNASIFSLKCHLDLQNFEVTGPACHQVSFKTKILKSVHWSLKYKQYQKMLTLCLTQVIFSLK